MSLAANLQKLEQQRDSELTLIRSRVARIADAMEHEASPAQWIGKHPYLATASAAMIGFVAAQLPPKSSPAVPHSSPAPSPPPPPSPPQATIWGELLPQLINLAEQFLQPQPESSPASLTIANAGSVDGPGFPRSSFSVISECPQ